MAYELTPDAFHTESDEGKTEAAEPVFRVVQIPEADKDVIRRRVGTAGGRWTGMRSDGKPQKLDDGKRPLGEY